MSSTFDETGYGVAPASAPPLPQTAEPPPSRGAHAASLSALERLREVSHEVDTRESIQFTNPLDTIRFTCRTAIEQREIQGWQRAALPTKVKALLTRRGGAPDLSQLDPVLFFGLMIANTCEQIEVKSSDGSWQPVNDGRTGEPLLFDDPDLREIFGAMDVLSAIKTAMNRNDAWLMEKGTEIQNAAGYGELGASGKGDDGVDPTQA